MTGAQMNHEHELIFLKLMKLYGSTQGFIIHVYVFLNKLEISNNKTKTKK